MINSSVYTNELNTLNANIFTIINKLKNQNKLADIDSIHKQLVKTTSTQELTKEDLLKKVHDLETEGKIVNKLNRNKDSFHVVVDGIVDGFAENIIEKTPIIFHDSFFETPNVNQTDSQSLSNSFSRESRSSSIPDFDIITNTPAVPHINHDAESITETESLADNMFEKLKVDGIKKETMSELQKSIENFFQNKLSVFKEKCEELVSKSYANGMVYFEKLEKEIKSKDQIINHLLVSLEGLTRCPNRNAVIDDTVSSPGLFETLPQSNQTGNSLESRRGIGLSKILSNFIPTKKTMMKITTLAIHVLPVLKPS